MPILDFKLTHSRSVFVHTQLILHGKPKLLKVKWKEGQRTQGEGEF